MEAEVCEVHAEGEVREMDGEVREMVGEVGGIEAEVCKEE